MPPSTTKKVFIHRFDREPVRAFAHPQTYLQPMGMEVLSPEGSLLRLAYRDVKCVAFVRDFPGDDWSTDRKVFHTRPKMEGLWVRMLFRDHDLMEGVLPNNFLALDPYGYSVVPPDPFSNTQKLYVPREALREMFALAVVGGKAGKKGKADLSEQPRLFE